MVQGALEVFAIDIRNSYIKVNWDTVKQTINVPLWGKVGDTARGIELTILQNGARVIPNLEKIKLYWQKPDGTKGFVAASKIGDFFYLENLNQMFTVEGTVDAEFELETNGQFLKSPTFYPIVETSLANGVESSDQFSALQQALLDISTYEAQLAGKVDKVAGKGLSTNDFDNVYKGKIDTDIPAQLADIPNTYRAKTVKIETADLSDTVKQQMAETTVEDGSITPQKTSFIKIERYNLFDKTKAVASTRVDKNTSDPISYASTYTSDFIPVTVGENYFVGTANTPGGLMYDANAWKFYDANKQPINTTATSWNPIPSGVAYMRFSFWNSALNIEMFVKGTVTPTVYVGYDQNVTAAITDIYVGKAIKNKTTELLGQEGGLTGDMLNEKTINPNKLDFIKKYNLNLFDSSLTLDDYNLNATGATTSATGIFVSDYIPVMEGRVYSIFPNVTNIAYYDKDKIFLSKASTTQSQSPAKARYMRFALSLSSKSVTYVTESDYFVADKPNLNTYKASITDNIIANAIADSLEEFGSKLFIANRYNLFDRNRAAKGTVNESTGVITLGVGYGYVISDFISAEIATYSMPTVGVAHKVLFYDANKAFISGLSTTTQFTISNSNIKYFRVALYGAESSGGIIVKGNVNNPTFVPYEVLSATFRHSKYKEDIAKEIGTATEFNTAVKKLRTGSAYGKKWACLGDSITKMGWGNNYASMVAEKLGLVPLNYGIISSTIMDDSSTTGDNPMSIRYVDMDNEAEIITVFAGVNDPSSKLGNPSDRSPVDSLYGACHTLFSGLTAKYPGKKIGIMGPCQHARVLPTDTESGAPDTDLTKLKSKIAVIKEVAEYYSLPFLDLCREGGINGFVEAHRTTYFQADKLHLTTAGHQVIARRIEDFIRSL